MMRFKFLLLFLLLGLDGAYPGVGPDCQEVYLGSDEFNKGDVYSSFRLALTLSPPNGNLVVEGWHCFGQKASSPAKCPQLISHFISRVSGSAKSSANHVSFQARSATNEVIFPKGKEFGNYCLDLIEGEIDGRFLRGTHSDDCNPVTEIVLEKRECKK